MTDQEIMKALECCLKHYACIDCPVRGREGCMSALYKGSLAIITRQQVEIEKLQEIHADTTESLRLAAEANKGMQAKIESLEVENEEQDRAIINALHRMGGIRAETVREFAEKLKLIIGFDDLVPTDCVMLFPYIDNLVEEMEK